MQFANVARCFGLLALFLTAMKHHFYSFTLLTGEMTVKDLSLDNGIFEKKKKKLRIKLKKLCHTMLISEMVSMLAMSRLIPTVTGPSANKVQNKTAFSKRICY